MGLHFQPTQHRAVLTTCSSSGLERRPLHVGGGLVRQVVHVDALEVHVARHGVLADTLNLTSNTAIVYTDQLAASKR